jgi:hypothetical protein
MNAEGLIQKAIDEQKRFKKLLTMKMFLFLLLHLLKLEYFIRYQHDVHQLL